MNWEFEHWDNGKVYLHEQRWAEFKKHVEKFGYNEQRHHWNHKRMFCKLHTPRDVLHDLPAYGPEDTKFNIYSVTAWWLVYEAFPAFERTDLDPEGWLPSWHLWAEDKITNPSQDEVRLFQSSSWYISGYVSSTHNYYALFRGQYWLVEGLKNYGLGVAPPPEKEKKKGLCPRSIFEPFETTW